MLGVEARSPWPSGNMTTKPSRSAMASKPLICSIISPFITNPCVTNSSGAPRFGSRLLGA